MIRLVAAASVSLGIALAAPNPMVCDLAPGETCTVALAGGRSRVVKLVGFTEERSHFWDKSKRAFVPYVTGANVEIEVDGRRASVHGGPFQLPQEVNGVNVLPSATSGWLDGTVPDEIDGDVRLEVMDADEAWYGPERFTYPIADYRWRAMNYQHTWLGICVHQGALYYHRGEDMGMIPDRGAALAITDAIVKTNPAPHGDGRSNGFVISDATGLTYRYAHMNSPNIRVNLEPGGPVAKGEKIGLTGETWNGKPQQVDPHLHLGIEDAEGRRRNSYPLIVAAYQSAWPRESLPVAGGWRHLWAGEEIELDASLSIPAIGRRIVSHEWTFTDGSRASGAKVRRQYARPGVYAEQLTVVDSKGYTAVDFVEVFVHDRSAADAPPNGWVNYFPVRGIKPEIDVEFLSHASRMKNVTIDFGDGTSSQHKNRLFHRYRRPGTYVVTLSGESAGAGPGTFRLAVIVE